MGGEAKSLRLRCFSYSLSVFICRWQERNISFRIFSKSCWEGKKMRFDFSVCLKFCIFIRISYWVKSSTWLYLFRRTCLKTHIILLLFWVNFSNTVSAFVVSRHRLFSKANLNIYAEKFPPRVLSTHICVGERTLLTLLFCCNWPKLLTTLPVHCLWTTTSSLSCYQH